MRPRYLALSHSKISSINCTAEQWKWGRQKRIFNVFLLVTERKWIRSDGSPVLLDFGGEAGPGGHSNIPTTMIYAQERRRRLEAPRGAFSFLWGLWGRVWGRARPLLFRFVPVPRARAFPSICWIK
jgi:hypothetical protein